MITQVTWNVAFETWQAFVDACPNATFFHSAGWYQAQAARYGYRPAAVLVRFESGERALLPLAIRPRFKGLVQEAQSGIEGGYGGPVSPSPLTEDQVKAIYQLVLQRHPDLRLIGNPLDPQANVAMVSHSTVTDFTQALPLLPRVEQLKLMTSSRAKSVRRGHEEGFDLAVHAGLNEADIREFFNLYADHAAEWAEQRWVRDVDYFRALIRSCGRRLVLFMAYHEGRPAGFRLVGYQGGEAVALHVARAKYFESWNVGPYLAAESMAWCAEQGMRRLDLMSSGALESVKAYKASFGAQSLPFSTSVATSQLCDSLQGLWQRLRQKPAMA